MRLPYQLLCCLMLPICLAACDAKTLADMQKSPEQKRAEQLHLVWHPAKTIGYKETVQVEREIFTYGGRYSCRDEIVEPKGKKAYIKREATEPARVIEAEHGYFRSLAERPCSFKNGKASLPPKKYSLKQAANSPILICKTFDAAKAYPTKTSGCKRTYGALVSFEAWE